MRLFAVLMAFLLTAAIVGCSSAIMNVDGAPVTNASGKPLSHEQVRGAILRAGSALGWKMTEEGPNILIGTLLIRTHTAVVEIPYSTTSYSIKYRSSVNLEERGGQIHKNYNGWIQNLTRDINAQLSAS
jgi:hypothetical protein